MAQSVLNVTAALGCISASLIVSALEQRNPNGGWRDYFWIQMAMCGFGGVVSYRPLKRHNRLENLPLMEKLKYLDLPGCGILLAGLDANIPATVPPAILQAGLPPTSIASFMTALTSNNSPALADVAGVTPAITAIGRNALRPA